MEPDDEGTGRRVGGAIGGAIDTAVDRVGAAGRSLGEVFRLPGQGNEGRTRPTNRPGSAAGLEHAHDVHLPPDEGEVTFVVVDYGPQHEQRRELDLGTLLNDERPAWATVRWIRVEGLHPHVIDQLRQHHGLSSLAAEDVLHVPQRPRTEAYDDHLFVVSQLWEDAGADTDTDLQQVAIFLFHDLVLSFQERRTSVWEPIEARLKKTTGRMRNARASYLVYALLDTIVDHGFPLMEVYADRLDQLEESIMREASPELLQELHAVKRELSVVRRMLWPTRELVAELRRDEHTLIDGVTRAFLADVENHCVQLSDIAETLRDLGSSLTDLYLSMSSNHTNEAMRVLTMIATIFIPITFLAGVYGMNFRYIPEIEWRYAYPSFWALCTTLTIGLLWYFKRRGWFDGR